MGRQQIGSSFNLFMTCRGILNRVKRSALRLRIWMNCNSTDSAKQKLLVWSLGWNTLVAGTSKTGDLRHAVGIVKQPFLSTYIEIADRLHRAAICSGKVQAGALVAPWPSGWTRKGCHTPPKIITTLDQNRIFKLQEENTSKTTVICQFVHLENLQIRELVPKFLATDPKIEIPWPRLAP
jgi:hypothetical protein